MSAAGGTMATAALAVSVIALMISVAALFVALSTDGLPLGGPSPDPTTIAVPTDVLGLPEADSRTRLEQAGFQVEVEYVPGSDGFDGEAVSVAPTEALPGSVITLQVIDSRLQATPTPTPVP